MMGTGVEGLEVMKLGGNKEKEGELRTESGTLSAWAKIGMNIKGDTNKNQKSKKSSLRGVKGSGSMSSPIQKGKGSTFSKTKVKQLKLTDMKLAKSQEDPPGNFTSSVEDQAEATNKDYTHLTSDLSSNLNFVDRAT